MRLTQLPLVSRPWWIGGLGQPPGASPRFPREPDASACRLMVTCQTKSVGILGAAALFLLVVAPGCQLTNHTERGALVGGLTGAGLGAAIGDATGHAGTGAAIGAGVGSVTGAAIGSDIDRAEAEYQAAHHAVRAQAITATDIINMSKAGVEDGVIITQIRTQGVLSPPTTEEVILLQQQGISGAVIQAFQSAPQLVITDAPPARTIVTGPPPMFRGVVVAPGWRGRPMIPMRPRRHRFHW